MVQIEKGIPIPKRVRSGGGGRPPVVGRDVADALTKMEIDDSVKVERHVNKNTLYVFLSREGKRTGKKFRFSPEIGGYRIWRIM